tara:strand:+ start:8955 stop:9173 length:219 start_codon:yes stop_codon:yes gene_type:complete
MEKDIYYENINISINTLTLFEKMYEEKKKEIVSDLKKTFKEKYNIHINESKLSKDVSINTSKCITSTTDTNY